MIIASAPWTYQDRLAVALIVFAVFFGIAIICAVIGYFSLLHSRENKK